MRKTLTVEELKYLLLARFSAEESKQAKLQARIQQELGDKAQEKEPEETVLKNKIADWIADVLARRLKRNRRTIPLLLSRDLDRFITVMFEHIEQTEGGVIDAKRRKILGRYLKAIFNNIIEMAYNMFPEDKNPYEEYWRWVRTVLDLAAERRILPTELLTLESATDEIARRMFSKEQFLALSRKAISRFTDADALSKLLIQPTLDMLAKDSKERRELERDLEELMPQLREAVAKTKVVTYTWLDEEAARIYATV